MHSNDLKLLVDEFTNLENVMCYSTRTNIPTVNQ